MRRFIIGFIAILILITAEIASYKPQIEPYHSIYNPKIHYVAEFLRRHKCLHLSAGNLVSVAEQNKIDYRILPALTLREQSCRTTPNNNMYGMGSASNLMHFKSVADGSAYVGSALIRSPYAGKSLKSMLSMYGPHSNPDYAQEVINIMNEMPPVD